MKIKRAVQVRQERCDCGCGQAYVYLLDGKGRDFACFSLMREEWIPFAEDAIRCCDQKPVVGGPQHRTTVQ